ncbi:protein takeout [Culex quinquefasciatus]|uniref:protein takeout n=1 Tax=Culex quinquefasciatus TaxID=7176 RepID=UPI0018E3AB10|nr:protein takeout [Culex quinquefasciatus]
MELLLCVVFLVSTLSTGFAQVLPPTFQLCHRSDPKFDKCLSEAITGALRAMKNGIPEFGILPINPLAISALSIQQGASSPINLKQDFKNLKLTHLADSVVTRSKTDLDKFVLRSEAVTPYMEIFGDYTMEGRVLLLPVTGRGFANITLHGLKTKHELIGEPVQQNGETFMRIKKYNVKLEEPKHMTIFFGNLFNGDVALGNAMNGVMNDNWQLMFRELRGAFEDTFGYIFKDISNKLFLKVPMNRIFLN